MNYLMHLGLEVWGCDVVLEQVGTKFVQLLSLLVPGYLFIRY